MENSTYRLAVLAAAQDVSLVLLLGMTAALALIDYPGAAVVTLIGFLAMSLTATRTHMTLNARRRIGTEVEATTMRVRRAVAQITATTTEEGFLIAWEETAPNGVVSARFADASRVVFYTDVSPTRPSYITYVSDHAATEMLGISHETTLYEMHLRSMDEVHTPSLI